MNPIVVLEVYVFTVMGTENWSVSELIPVVYYQRGFLHFAASSSTFLCRAGEPEMREDDILGSGLFFTRVPAGHILLFSFSLLTVRCVSSVTLLRFCPKMKTVVKCC